MQNLSVCFACDSLSPIGGARGMPVRLTLRRARLDLSGAVVSCCTAIHGSPFDKMQLIAEVCSEARFARVLALDQGRSRQLARADGEVIPLRASSSTLRFGTQ